MRKPRPSTSMMMYAESNILGMVDPISENGASTMTQNIEEYSMMDGLSIPWSDAPLEHREYVL